jgi:hypothetical protein
MSDDDKAQDWCSNKLPCARYETQAAEIERLRELIKITGDHWLALQHKHPIQWEGAIDGAMAAACAEIERLREALTVLAPMVNWLPHPDCITAETAIRAALAGKEEQ